MRTENLIFSPISHLVIFTKNNKKKSRVKNLIFCSCVNLFAFFLFYLFSYKHTKHPLLMINLVLTSMMNQHSLHWMILVII